MLSRLNIILLLSLGLTTCLHLNGSGTVGSKDSRIEDEYQMVVDLYKMCGKSAELERLKMTTITFKNLPGMLS